MLYTLRIHTYIYEEAAAVATTACIVHADSKRPPAPRITLQVLHTSRETTAYLLVRMKYLCPETAVLFPRPVARETRV